MQLSLVGGDDGGRSISHWLGSRSISDGFLLVNILSISVVELLADLLGEGQVNVLAVGGSKLGDALLVLLNSLLNLRDSDALLSSQVLTADSDEVNGLVNTGLDGLREGNLDSGLHNSDNRDIVASLLGNLFAVVVAITVVSISWGRLADSYHLGVTHLLERNFNSLGSGVNNLLGVRVDTDLIGNDLNRLTAHSAGNWVALLNIDDPLHRDINIGTDSFKSRGAHFSGLNNINNRAVVLGGMVGRSSVVDRGSMVGRGSMVDNWGSMVGWGSMVSWCSMVGVRAVRWDSISRSRSIRRHEGDEADECKKLKII
jgi:hypothetical protein